MQDLCGLRRYGKVLPAEKIIMTGNPVRQNLLWTFHPARRRRKVLRIEPGKKTILILGQSLEPHHQSRH